MSEHIPSSSPPPLTGADDGRLAAAYAELANLLLHGPDVVGYLQQVAQLVASVVVPPASCGVTMRRGTEVSTVASTGELASLADELQYGRGRGPCLQAMRQAEMVHVPDMAAETRWGDYGVHAVAAGVGSSLSLPLVIDGKGVGALNVYSTRQHRFSDQEIGQAAGFAAQASTLLAVVMAQSRATELTDQMQAALTARAVIDQALGIVMAQQQCTATEAFAVLREASQHRNSKLATVAAELIRTSTGHDAESPRPFSRRS